MESTTKRLSVINTWCKKNVKAENENMSLCQGDVKELRIKFKKTGINI